MKALKNLLLIAFIGLILAVGYNIFSIKSMEDQGLFEKNQITIASELIKRLNPSTIGLLGGFLSGDIISSLGGKERIGREYCNIILALPTIWWKGKGLNSPSETILHS